MRKLIISPQALIDVENIFDYTAQTWTFKQAEKYQNSIFARMKDIAKNPLLGETYYFTKGNYRKIKINRHLLFYRYDQTNCNIVRVLHEKMDLNFRLG